MIVSIITPTYNRANVLDDTIQSVLAQTIDSFEYIIVDDGSTDETEQLVNKYNDKRIKYIQLSGNKGANAARNRGINEASGEYITFLDSDDRYVPKRLETIINIFKKQSKEVYCVSHSFESISENKVCRRFRVPEGRIAKIGIRSKNVVGGFSNVIFRSEAFDEIGMLDESLPSYQDYEFFIRGSDTGDIYGHDEILCEKRGYTATGSTERISDNIDKKIRGGELLLDKHSNKLTSQGHAMIHYNRGILYMLEKDVTASRRAFKKAMYTYPYQPKYTYNYVASLGGESIFKKADDLKKKIGLFLSR